MHELLFVPSAILASVLPVHAAYCTAEWGLRGPDLRSHHPPLACTHSSGNSLCFCLQVRMLMCVFTYLCVCVCIFRVNTNHRFLFFHLNIPLSLCVNVSLPLLLVLLHPPQGTVRTAAVPMTTSVLLSITKAALSSLAYILYMQHPQF